MNQIPIRYLFAAILLFLSVPAYSADRLVPSQYGTIQAAVNAASPGDRILVSNGEYPESVSINKANLTFQSVNYLGARLVGGNTRVNGFLSQGNNISGITIDGFEIFGYTSRGIGIASNTTGMDGWTIRRNKIHHCWQFALYIREGNNHLIEDNYIYFIGNTAEAYAIYSFSDGTIIRRNTIHTASKNLVRMRNGTTLDSNILYHADTCLAVNGGPGGNSAYNNYIYDCLSAMKPKHNECTNSRNNGRERFWHNTVTDFGNVGLDIAENEPRTKCIDGRNNVFHRSGVRGDSAVMEKRGLVDVPSVINGNFYDMKGLTLYTDATSGLESTTLADMRTRYGYETNGVVGDAKLINIQKGVFYGAGSAVLNPGPNTGSPYTTQVGARNLVQTTPMIQYIDTLRAINASHQAGTVSRLTDGQKLPIWNSGTQSGWVILEVNNGQPATFGYFSYLLFVEEVGGKIRNFTLQSGPTANGPWTQILDDQGRFSFNASFSFFEFPAPVSAAYLRFNFLDVMDNMPVYISEFDLFNMIPQSGTPPPPPPPDPDDPPPPRVDHAAPPLYTGGEGTGTQRYISPGGAGTTCSSGTPCSWTTAINASQPNDAVIFMDGTYPITMNTVRSGQEGRHIVIKAQNEGVPLINGSAQDLVHIEHSYITIRGLHFFDTKAGLPNATFSGGGLVLMRVNNTSGAHHIIIEDNTFKECANACINVFGITTKNSHIIIRNNFFDGAGYKADAGGRPIRISTPLVGNPGVEDTMIYGNIIQDFTGPAIEISDTGKRTWIWDNDIRGAATAASHGTSPEPPRDGLILNRGSETYFYRNVVRDSAFGAKILTTRVSATGAKSLFYNNVFDSITGNDDAVYCEAGNIGPSAEVYNNTFRGLTDHTVGTGNCAITVLNNIGINGVTGNLATADFTDAYFNDAPGNDFTLTVNATGAIDDVGAPPFSTTDKTGKGIFGAARDYGAFEYGGFGPPPPPPGTGFPTTAVLDNFNRANEDPIAGNWVNGVSGTGACKVDTNTLRRSSGTFDCYYNTQYGASQELYVTLPNQTNPGDGTSARIRGCVHGGIGAAGTYNAYSLQWQKRADTDRMMIFKVTSGSGVQIGDYFEQELVNGNKVGLEILSDGTLNAYADTGSGFELKFTRNDSSPFDCTNTYISANPQGNANHWFDDFGGGTSVATIPGNLLVPRPIFFD